MPFINRLMHINAMNWLMNIDNADAYQQMCIYSSPMISTNVHIIHETRDHFCDIHDMITSVTSMDWTGQFRTKLQNCSDNFEFCAFDEEL